MYRKVKFELRPEHINAYREGEGIKLMSRRLGVAKNTLKRRLQAAGIYQSGRSHPSRPTGHPLHDASKRPNSKHSKKPVSDLRVATLQGEVWRRERRLEIRTSQKYGALYRKHHVSAYSHARYKTDPAYKLRVILRKRLKKILKAKRGRPVTVQLLGCSYDSFRMHIESQFEKGMSWSNHGKTWHLDHIVPLDAFKLDEPEQLRKAFHYTNVRPLMARLNLAKSSKVVACQPELLLCL